MVMQLSKCLCCGLKTGSLVYGILCLLNSLPLFVQSGGQFINGPAEKDGDNTLHVIYGCLALKTLCEIIFSSLLIWGACKDNPKLVRPWVIYKVFELALWTLLTGAFMIMVFTFSPSYDDGHLDAYFVSSNVIVTLLLIHALVLVYFILVVNSYHTTIANGRKNENKVGHYLTLVIEKETKTIVP